MKKFVKSFLMAAAVLVLFAGCSNLSNATVSGTPEKAVIQIGIDNSVDYGTKSARTINPVAIASNTAPDTFGKITLSGTSEKGYELKDADDNTEVELSFTDGKAKIGLEYDVWYLTMKAYDKTDNTKLLLEGRRRIDLKNGVPSSSAFTFKLSSEGVNTPGNVTFTGLFINPLIDSNNASRGRLAAKYSAALYDLYTNEIVPNTTVEDACTTQNVTTTDADNNEVTTTYGKFNYNLTATVNPGRYNFRIHFYMNKGTADVPDYVAIGTWTDIVVVAPGRTTNGTDGSIGNIGDVLNKTPDKPTNLSAYYVGDPANKTSGNDFNVLIQWTPSASKNEDYYKLVIKDWTTGAAVDYKEFDADHEFFGSDLWVDGTLAGGTNSCTVKLPVGKKYEITLTAVNVIGASVAEPRKETGVTAVANHVAYGAEKINLMKVAYDLNGGTLKTAANKSQVGGFLNKYYIFEATEDFKIDVMKIETDTTKYPQLTKQNHPFLEWDENGTKVESITTFGNRTLKANYNVLSIVDYTIDDTYGSIDTEVKQSNEDVKNKVLHNNSAPITITVINPTGDPDVTHIQVRFCGLEPKNDIVIDDDVSDSEIVIATEYVKALEFRTYTVQVIATKADGKQYSNTFAITKQRKNN